MRIPQYVCYDSRFVEKRLIVVDIKFQKYDIPPVIVSDTPLPIVEQPDNKPGWLARRPFIDRIKNSAYPVFAEYPGVIAAPTL